MPAKVLALAAAAVFLHNPSTDTLYVTEDGNAFMTENPARNHAHLMKLPTPIVVLRSEVAEEIEVVLVKDEPARKAKTLRDAEEGELAARAKADADAANAEELGEPRVSSGSPGILPDAASSGTSGAVEGLVAGDPLGTTSSGGTSTSKQQAVDALKSSDVQPDRIKIKGAKTPLLDIVRMSFEYSGMTVEQWNAQPEDEREARIEKTIEALKA